MLVTERHCNKPKKQPQYIHNTIIFWELPSNDSKSSSKLYPSTCLLHHGNFLNICRQPCLSGQEKCTHMHNDQRDGYSRHSHLPAVWNGTWSHSYIVTSLDTKYSHLRSAAFTVTRAQALMSRLSWGLPLNNIIWKCIEEPHFKCKITIPYMGRFEECQEDTESTVH